MNDLITVSNSQEFEKILELRLCLVAFGVSWSSPCQNQYKILSNFIKIDKNTRKIAQVDIEKQPEIGQKYKIQAIPTIMLFKKGREIKRSVGLQSLEKIYKCYYT